MPTTRFRCVEAAAAASAASAALAAAAASAALAALAAAAALAALAARLSAFFFSASLLAARSNGVSRTGVWSAGVSRMRREELRRF